MQVDTARSLGEWEALVTNSFYPLAVRSGPENFSGAVRQVELPHGVRLAEVSTDTVRLRRDGRLVRSGPSDDLLLLLKLEGASRAESGHAVARIPAGGAMLFDPRYPYDVISEGRSHELVLTCPRTFIPVPAGEQGTAIKRQLPSTSVSLRALAGLLTELAVADTESVDLNELSDLSATVVDLVVTMMRSVGSRPEHLCGSAASQLRALQAFALRELANPRLSVEMMAAAHGISVRHVSAVFQKAGQSPASFIRGERLARARADLENPRHAHRSVAEIARSWGFYDMTTFARAFRRAHGVVPSAVRRVTSPH
jgi:AraC-like DNA-binding protein